MLSVVGSSPDLLAAFYEYRLSIFQASKHLNPNNRFKKVLKIKQIQQDSSSANKNEAMLETTQKLQKPKCFSPPTPLTKWIEYVEMTEHKGNLITCMNN